MMRNWIAVALLSASWMWGLEYYTPTNGWLWSIALVAAVLLAAEFPRRLPRRVDAWITILLMLPALWILSWPYRAIPLGLALGLMPFAIGNAPPAIARLGWGAVRSAVILTGQAIALHGYSLLTARCHDLPSPGPTLVAAAVRLLGAETSADGANVILFSTSGPQRLGVTWELLFDPVTLGLMAGAIVLVSLWTWEDGVSTERSTARVTALRWLSDVGRVLLAMALWIPVRCGLLLGLFLQREMRAPEDLKLTVMNQFFSPWVLAAAGLGAVLGLTYLVRRRQTEPPGRPQQATGATGLRARLLAAGAVVGLVGIATGLFTVDPIGKPRGGRVVFVERHSNWEPTDRPYDTKSYGEDPSYSYSAIYRYCQQYFDVSRLEDDESIDAARLADCDVLVIKTPTEAYSAEEVGAILRFVYGGGGLLLIGEHTDFLLTGTHLNQIAEPLGFKFRPDNLFGVAAPYVQLVAPVRFPHPAIRDVPLIRYAGSCSIDPGWSMGRPAVWNTGLWGLGADYNMQNFFPEAYYRPEMRYGAYIQLWETRHGKGRVLAFTDSTIFSNFSTFEPGKAEMMLDMLSWLNCRSAFDSPTLRFLLRLSGGCVLLALIWLAVTRLPRTDGAWLVWLGAVLLGYLGSTQAIASWQRGGLLQCQRPQVRVVLDRNVSRVALSEGGFTEEPNGYGLLEQWIPRLGYYTVRAVGPETFTGDVLLVLSPNESVTEDYRRRLVQWVSAGGKLVVFDSLDSYGTTANSLLWPFGMSVYHATPAKGALRMKDSDWPGIALEAACQIEGGEPFMWVGDTTVAAKSRYGKGTVTAIGFGGLMNNTNMGGTWVAEPGPSELKNYEVLFELLKAVVEDRPMRVPQSINSRGEGATEPQSETNATIQKEP